MLPATQRKIWHTIVLRREVVNLKHPTIKVYISLALLCLAAAISVYFLPPFPLAETSLDTLAGSYLAGEVTSRYDCPGGSKGQNEGETCDTTSAKSRKLEK